MAETITLASAHDGFEFSAFHEVPFTPRKGGVIVLQEIFGVDKDIRADVERWAKMGFEAIAPALFDRRERDYHGPHTQDGIARGLIHARALTPEQWQSDIAACRDFLKGRGKVCVVGYCFGGSLGWIAAAQIDGLAAVSSYYGSLVAQYAALPVKCPVIVHLGHTDDHIPAGATEAAVKAAHPNVPVYIYEGAGHAFNSASTDRYNEEAADLARHRTLELFESV